MKEDYDKKDIRKSPDTKAVSKKKPDFPEGWGYYLKRGSHCVVNPDGKQFKFASKEAAMEFAND
jgi:hypothetical protein